MQIYERIREAFRDLKTQVGDLLSLMSDLLLLYTTEWSPDVPNKCGYNSQPCPGDLPIVCGGRLGCKWFFHNKPIAKNLL